MRAGCAAALLLMLVSPMLLAQARSDYCGDAAPPLGSQSRSGRYVNPTYGYSVRIPAGLQARIAPRGPERGFVIVLSQAPLAFIRVDAAYDVFYDISASGVHQRDLNTVRLHDTIQSDEAHAVRLAGEPALRSLMRFNCRGGQADRVHESVVAVRRREIYRLDLQTTPQRLPADTRLLSSLVTSWRWERPR